MGDSNMEYQNANKLRNLMSNRLSKLHITNMIEPGKPCLRLSNNMAIVFDDRYLPQVKEQYKFLCDKKENIESTIKSVVEKLRNL